jgi:hypothetical protein
LLLLLWWCSLLLLLGLRFLLLLLLSVFFFLLASPLSLARLFFCLRGRQFQVLILGGFWSLGGCGLGAHGGDVDILVFFSFWSRDIDSGIVHLHILRGTLLPARFRHPCWYNDAISHSFRVE